MAINAVRAQELLDLIIVDPEDTRTMNDRVRALLAKVYTSHEGKWLKLGLKGTDEAGALNGNALDHLVAGAQADATTEAPNLEYMLGLVMPLFLDFIDAVKPELETIAAS